MKRFVSVHFLTILVLLIWTETARAQTTSLSVSPAILESIVKPGEKVKSEIVVTNATNAPLPIKGYIRNFLPNEKLDDGDDSAYDASSWFTLDPPDFILQPREEKKIVVTVKAPKSVEPGGHYATVYFEPLLPQGLVTSQGTVSLARVGVLAFLVAPGDIKEGMEITGISFPAWVRRGPITGSVKLKNTGNLHMLPSSTFFVTDMWGRVTVLTPAALTLMPGTSRDQPVVWDKKIGFGKYSIRGEYVYGAEKQKLQTESVIVYLIPWHLFLLVGIPLTSLFYFVIVGRKRIGKAWSVLTGKADTWQKSSATTITLEDLQKENNNVPPKPKKPKKSTRRSSSRQS